LGPWIGLNPQGLDLSGIMLGHGRAFQSAHRATESGTTGALAAGLVSAIEAGENLVLLFGGNVALDPGFGRGMSFSVQKGFAT
jgi:hypothetical protein